jgi:hypothetical protein
MHGIYVAFCTQMHKCGMLQEARAVDCYRTFIRLLYCQWWNIITLCRIQIRCKKREMIGPRRSLLEAKLLKRNWKWRQKKNICVTGLRGPQGCERSRLPHFLDNRLTDGGEVVILTCRPPFTPKKISGTHLCQRLSRLQGHNTAGRIRLIENFSDLIGNRTHELPGCSIVPVTDQTYHECNSMWHLILSRQ